MIWGYGLFYDSTMILAFIGLALSLLASARVKSAFSKYSKVRIYSGMTGAMAAQRILEKAGIYDVRIERVQGSLTDHYDPVNKILRLSDSVYNAASISAVGVAAHECGHAIQDNKGYVPLKIRGAIVPAVNISSSLSWPIFVAGLFFSIQALMTVGIILFSLAVIFQIITLPVEFNASSRALNTLKGTGILSEDESKGAAVVLRAAGLTYVASLAATALQLLRLIILRGGRNRD